MYISGLDWWLRRVNQEAERPTNAYGGTGPQITPPGSDSFGKNPFDFVRAVHSGSEYAINFYWGLSAADQPWNLRARVFPIQVPGQRPTALVAMLIIPFLGPPVPFLAPLLVGRFGSPTRIEYRKRCYPSSNLT